MAAVCQPRLDICDLRRISASDLSGLLEEETEYWRDQLDWDFKPSADLVRRFTDARVLRGAALVCGSEIVGYSYSLVEEHKGIIGDFYVRAAYRSPENEYALLNNVLEDLVRTPMLHRIESQLILFGSPKWTMPRAQQLQTFEREFLSLDLNALDALPSAPHPGIAIEPWGSHLQEAAAHLITNAYSGHVDALINDQYRSLPGARRFLFNIVQFPGCGSFLEEASVAAFQKDMRWLIGLCLASLVGPQTGHITQICLARDARGKGLGYEMLRQTLLLMRLHDAKRASLTVTSANRVAIDLYRKMGFHVMRRFPAFVWEGF